MSRIGILFVAAVAIAGFTAPAQAGTVDLELALLIDGSGSISASDFTLQKDGYVAALTNHLVADGSVAVGVWQFSNSSSLEYEYALTVIDTDAKKTALLAAITGMSQIGSTTDISGAIFAAQNVLIPTTSIDGDRLIIDVSTDGNQVGGLGSPETYADDALDAGIDQVNGIFVGSGINTSWVPVDRGSFFLTASSFAEFNAAIDRKIKTEISGVVPVPAAAWMGLGMLGLLGALRRIRRRD